MEYKRAPDGSVPVMFCERQQKWLPVEEHSQCEYFTAEVYDEAGDPVSFICTYSEECKKFQPGWVDDGEIGRGEAG